ncbi:uncharacterized protein PHACADRAFT_202035 [Phanerochaete carnosa HHB-10118-sp]|nr:uncharacterized protein PHACADRAFT_202035 [Phanerochaete carnosa HHB-10118-sp]EKM49085.1 hypothetical protein PHACADRAFT_202035 [Phanerochaete carnosa HHB-10118-sp]
MIREPAIDLPNNVQAAAARVWIENSEGHAIAKEAFESTLPLRYAPERQVCHGRSHVARSVQRPALATRWSVKRAMAGRTLYIRFTARIDDAMGTNMVSKARSSRRSRLIRSATSYVPYNPEIWKDLLALTGALEQSLLDNFALIRPAYLSEEDARRRPCAAALRRRHLACYTYDPRAQTDRRRRHGRRAGGVLSAGFKLRAL